MTNKFWRHMNIPSQGIEYTPVCDALFSNINRYIDYQHTFILSQYSLLFLRRYVNNIPSIFYEAVSELAQELVLETKICGFDSHQPHHMSHQHNGKCTRLRNENNGIRSSRISDANKLPQRNGSVVVSDAIGPGSNPGGSANMWMNNPLYAC